MAIVGVSIAEETAVRCSCHSAKQMSIVIPAPDSGIRGQAAAWDPAHPYFSCKKDWVPAYARITKFNDSIDGDSKRLSRLISFGKCLTECHGSQA